MEIVRYLRMDQLRADGYAQINLRVCWSSQKVRVSIKGTRAKPSEWDEAAGRVKGRGVKFASEVNARLDAYEHGLVQFFYQQENLGKIITAEMVRDEVERIRLQLLGKEAPKAPKEVSIKLPEFWQKFIDDHRGLKSDNYVRHFKPVFDHLKGFRPRADFKDITLSFAHQFVQYLMSKGLSDDSAYNALKKIRAVLKYAKRCGIDVPTDYEDFPARSSHIEREFLTQEELTQLEQTVMVDGFFQRQRDVFLFACYTGLRWSDLPQVQPGNLLQIGQETLLRVIQTKTGKANPIPLSGYALRILKKYPDGLPLVAQQVYNRALKEIGKLAGLNRMITVSRYYNGKRLDSQHQLWEVISSHTARHTFATISLKRGMGVIDVQQLLGHGRLDSTMIYSHLMIGDKLEAMRRAWGDELPEN